ncbi:MAG: iron dependent repressor, metal binding and dimerization domain protein [Actinomycetota bacterium]
MASKETPVHVVPCPGATPSARLAQDVAARLEDLPAARDADGVIAIDGCGSGCASRTLEARGVAATTVRLDAFVAGDAAADADRDEILAYVVARLEAIARRTPARGSHRRPDPPPAIDAGERRWHTPDDYLYAISMLTTPLVACGTVVADQPTLASHVARVLSVSRPTAGEMLARLEADGRIARGPGKEILLTEAGKEAARTVVRRHRVIERLLTDVFDYTIAESHGLAAQIREGFDERMVERIASTLTGPERCPHGWPLDPSRDAEELADVVALSSLPGGTATVVALAERDGELLARLCASGLVPGGAVEVLDRRAEGMAVAVDGVRRDLDADAAAAVLVRPWPRPSAATGQAPPAAEGA